MTLPFKPHFWIAFTALIVLAGCSSGGESGTGLQQSQTTQGQITGFGSIFVNGVEYNTDQAAVKINGADDDEASLAVGMVVTVKGSVNADGVNGTADEVISKTEVAGLVLLNNIAVDKTLNIMQQTVHISNDTKFKPASSGLIAISELAPNDVVAVNGYSDGEGDIYATYVEVLAVNTGGVAAQVKLNGIVSDPSGSESSGSFKIGGLDINFGDDATTQFAGLTRSQLLTQDQLFVSVTGGPYNAGSPLLAATITKLDMNNEGEGTELEMEGVVTGITTLNTDAGQFAVNGRMVTYTGATQFDGGGAMDIVLDRKLEIEGTVQADNSILAHDIAFRDESNMEIEGTVTALAVNSLTLTDDLMNVVTIMVNQYTSYLDEADETNRYFKFGDITQGMTLEVKYYDDAELGKVATSIIKTSP